MPRSVTLRTYTPSDKHYTKDERAAVVEVRDGVDFFTIEHPIYTDMHAALVALGYELVSSEIPCRKAIQWGGKPLSMTKVFTYQLSGVKTLEQELADLQAQMQADIFDGFDHLLGLLVSSNPATRNAAAGTLAELVRRGCLNAERRTSIRSATAQWGGQVWRKLYHTCELRDVLGKAERS